MEAVERGRGRLVAQADAAMRVAGDAAHPQRIAHGRVRARQEAAGRAGVAVHAVAARAAPGAQQPGPDAGPRGRRVAAAGIATAGTGQPIEHGIAYLPAFVDQRGVGGRVDLAGQLRERGLRRLRGGREQHAVVHRAARIDGFQRVRHAALVVGVRDAGEARGVAIHGQADAGRPIGQRRRHEQIGTGRSELPIDAARRIQDHEAAPLHLSAISQSPGSAQRLAACSRAPGSAVPPRQAGLAAHVDAGRSRRSATTPPRRSCRLPGSRSPATDKRPDRVSAAPHRAAGHRRSASASRHCRSPGPPLPDRDVAAAAVVRARARRPPPRRRCGP